MGNILKYLYSNNNFIKSTLVTDKQGNNNLIINVNKDYNSMAILKNNANFIAEDSSSYKFFIPNVTVEQIQRLYNILDNIDKTSLLDDIDKLKLLENKTTDIVKPKAQAKIEEKNGQNILSILFQDETDATNEVFLPLLRQGKAVNEKINYKGKTYDKWMIENPTIEIIDSIIKSDNNKHNKDQLLNIKRYISSIENIQKEVTDTEPEKEEIKTSKKYTEIEKYESQVKDFVGNSSYEQNKPTTNLTFIDVEEETDGRYFIGIVQPSNPEENKKLAEIIKFCFPRQEDYSEDFESGNHSIIRVNKNGSYMSVYVLKSNYTDFSRFRNILIAYNFDASGLNKVGSKFISEGKIKKTYSDGQLRGYVEAKEVTNANGTVSRIPSNNEDAFYRDLHNYNRKIIKDGKEIDFELFREQERGIKFLVGRDSAILGDDTGLGKCLAPNTLCQVNNELLTMEDIWNKYSKNIKVEENEEWAECTKNISVNSINENREIIEGNVTALYREKYKGKLLKYKTSFGKEIITTYTHKFLTLNDWKNNLNKNDIIIGINYKDNAINIQNETIVNVEEIEHEGYIYDMTVDKYHNYIAGDLICHNTAQLIISADMRMKKTGGQTLIVTLPSVQSQFINEIRAITGTKSISNFPDPNAKWMVMKYSEFGAGKKGFRQLNIAVLKDMIESGKLKITILDELHSLKNPKSNQTDMLTQITKVSPTVWGATATVIPNHPIDLYYQLKAVNNTLGLLERKDFERHFLGGTTSQSISGELDEEVIAEAISKLKEWLINMGVYLQRSKSDVREDMPENTVTSKDIEVDRKRVQDYFNTKMARRDQTKKLIPIVTLNYMRESLAYAKSFESAKEAIESIEQGKKIAMFTAFQSSNNKFFEIVSEYLASKGKRAAQIIGGLSDNERNKIVEDFKDPSNNLVALSIGIKAGGTGMDFPNITDKVLVNDFDWTAASADQLEGRFFRIISNSDIETKYFIASDPTDQMLFERLNVKRAIANKIRILSSAQVNLIEKGFKQDSKEIKSINSELAKALKEERENNQNNKKKDAYILSKHYNASLSGRSDEEISRVFAMFDDSEVNRMAAQIANNDLFLDERIQKIFAQRILTVKEGPKKRGRPKKIKESSRLVPIIKWT